MKSDLAEKESLEAKRAQQEEESRENSKLISEQKAVRNKPRFFILHSASMEIPVKVWIHTVDIITSVIAKFQFFLK